jgi:hypothetical protein
MRLNPLSPRVVALSWGAALLAWPLAWLLLAVAQGLGTVIAGGGWIGVAVPLALHPWGIVNEPTIAFAGTRAALFLYWLAPLLAALVLAALLPTVIPVPPSWLSEVGVFQLAFACAVLGLGWAPPLGVADGPAAGLARFWGVSVSVFLAVAAVLGALAVQLAVARLASHLWAEPGGPLRGRRLLVVLAHGFVPAALWLGVVVVQGWAVPPLAVATTAAVLVGSLFGAWFWVPSSPLHPRPNVRWSTVVVLIVLGAAGFAAAAWAGAPRRGHGAALVWGFPGQTNNVRPGMAVVRVMPLRAPRRPPAR